MKIFAGCAAALAMSALPILSLGVATPAQAAGCWGPRAVAAAKLRNLDIMLMVTALRCRMGPDNFQADYNDFSVAHEGELHAANILLKAELGDAPHALDKLNTSIANSFGSGHPELGCSDLAQVTRDLSNSRVSGALLAAADALVGAPTIPAATCGVRVATVRR